MDLLLGESTAGQFSATEGTMPGELDKDASGSETCYLPVDAKDSFSIKM